MTKKLIWFVVMAVIFIGLGVYYKDQILSYYHEYFPKGIDFNNLSFETIDEIKKQILTPPPLKNSNEDQNTVLTNLGVIKYTNLEREKIGIGILKPNKQLEQAAKAKTDDMFLRQYFEHESPQGLGPSDLAQKAGYEYLMIGENLALGNFENDEKLIAAWMASEGHRANILNSKFTEIGVAVVKGVYEGKNVWIAVQEFGRPLSFCVQPDKLLKTQIENLKTEIDDQAQIISQKKDQIDELKKRKNPQVNNLINEYNFLIDQYNNLLAQLKSLTEKYNKQVSQFNICISQ